MENIVCIFVEIFFDYHLKCVGSILKIVTKYAKNETIPRNLSLRARKWLQCLDSHGERSVFLYRFIVARPTSQPASQQRVTILAVAFLREGSRFRLFIVLSHDHDVWIFINRFLSVYGESLLSREKKTFLLEIRIMNNSPIR